MESAERCAWLQSAVAHASDMLTLANVCKISVASSQDGPENPDDRFPTDPEKLEYLLKLLKALYDARFIAASYNLVVILAIFVLSCIHRRETRSRTRLPPNSLLAADQQPSSSSSSSTIEGMATSLGHVKAASDVVDVERLPLLGSKQALPQKKGLIPRAVSSWLARQPPPVPIINKTLPSNGTSLFIASWICLNVSVHLLLLPFRWDFFFVFADKAGFMFIVNLPLLYLLSAKNQPLSLLTGYSYEALNIFHRRVGEFMCFEAVVHFIGMVVWQFVLMADWLKASTTPRDYWTHPLILFGIASFSSYQLLFLTSMGSFRQRWYEIFLASHVSLQIAALIFLWMHYYTSRPYVALSLMIFLVDRIIWRLNLKRVSITADVRILEGGETLLVSADWDLPSLSDKPSRRWWLPSCFQPEPLTHGWQPTDHVFISVPVLGRSHALQAHPFTIASAAPPRRSVEPDPQRPVHAWLTLLIRTYDGFTADFLRYAETNSRVQVTLDGPYGSSHTLDMLRESDCAILVAGGSGIAVTFPLVWALLHDLDPQSQSVSGKTRRAGRAVPARQCVHLLWVTHSRSHRSWVPQQQFDELVSLGLNIVIPEPTAECGRPDVAGYVYGWIQGATAEGRKVGVVASGPDGLNRVVRNACADAIGTGLDVRVTVEKFGW
ncbi:ferric reductase like transmembrane component-domain-containing protein [Apodospora peruviana]|uniref:Ferric reductase like transmembrane component-domain-containing protein n=1 Tax=Apodospora peruviana TaxID=516989 RepID=A0AAE0IT70_9PEZI|nr:ferric reductase like transmembrane component-domain-containing protein [Apodospora peruviana]